MSSCLKRSIIARYSLSEYESDLLNTSVTLYMSERDEIVQLTIARPPVSQ
jgi:hypothetical protein